MRKKSHKGIYPKPYKFPFTIIMESTNDSMLSMYDLMRTVFSNELITYAYYETAQRVYRRGAHNITEYCWDKVYSLEQAKDIIYEDYKKRNISA